jgi:hypothetical protein
MELAVRKISAHIGGKTSDTAALDARRGGWSHGQRGLSFAVSTRESKNKKQKPAAGETANRTRLHGNAFRLAKLLVSLSGATWS